VDSTNPPPPVPCRTCGTCPTCGNRQPRVDWTWYPNVWYPNPWYPHSPYPSPNIIWSGQSSTAGNIAPWTLTNGPAVNGGLPS
jgi:hypothetical protein